MPKAPIPERFENRRVVTAAQMMDADARATREFRIPVLELMERAGRGVAELSAAWVEAKTGKPPSAQAYTACCGRGNNGGDGLVAARYLRGMGAQATAFLMAPKEGGYAGEVQENLRRALAAGVTVQQLSEDSAELDKGLAASDAALDALLGTGTSGKPAGLVKLAVQRLRAAAKPVIAVDLPTGIHPDTGYHSGVYVTAALTLTLALPKRGLLAAHAAANVGELHVVDLGYPPQLL